MATRILIVPFLKSSSARVRSFWFRSRVHRGHVVAMLLQPTGDPVSTDLHAAEDDHAVHIHALNQRHQQIKLLHRTDRIDLMLDRFGRRNFDADRDLDRVLEAARDQALDLLGHGRRKQQGLALLVAAVADDALHVINKARPACGRPRRESAVRCCSKSIVFCCTWSNKRPGVAITTSAPASSSWRWRP